MRLVAALEPPGRSKKQPRLTKGYLLGAPFVQPTRAPITKRASVAA